LLCPAERDFVVREPVYCDHRYRPSRLTTRVHGLDRRDRGDATRQRTAEAIRHEAAVRHSCDVHAPRIYRKRSYEVIDERGDEPNIINTSGSE
jgi:hypothetical protein